HTIEDYPIMHHLIVALTIARVGEKAGEFTNAEIKSCLGAALTMNISMLTLQAQLRLQIDPLTKEQREAIRQHPEQGASRLRLMGVTDERWLSIVANHHELPNGEGYPRQIRTVEKITLLLGVCDSFNARLAQREYRDNFTAEEAIKELFSKADPQMCELIAVLLEELGIYPAGSLLQLHGNQIGCSLIRGQSATSPVVLVFKNSGQSPEKTLLVDTSKREFSVRKALPRREISQLPSLLEIISAIA
ncbi:MAG: HD domain-containing phosphohydrolase, partial [Limnobacter sp.]|nr:HD domain-containing phosphohydrolase [Limnobacter sp.]